MHFWRRFKCDVTVYLARYGALRFERRATRYQFAPISTVLTYLITVRAAYSTGMRVTDQITSGLRRIGRPAPRYRRR